MKVIEIFNSIDGEVNGRGQGTLSTFIRLAGCNLSCDYCDTASSQDINSGIEMSVEEIIDQVQQIGCHKITITGGEPMLQIGTGLRELVQKLNENNFYSSIETNGTIDLALWKEAIPDCIIMNYKRQHPPLIENYGSLCNDDYVKVMIDCPEMIQGHNAVMFFDKLRNSTYARIAVSPVLNRVSVEQLIDFLQKGHLWYVQVNLQLHKFVQVQ